MSSYQTHDSLRLIYYILSYFNKSLKYHFQNINNTNISEINNIQQVVEILELQLKPQNLKITTTN